MFMLEEGHIALAKSLLQDDFYMAWGTIPEGEPVWSQNPPALDPNTTNLLQEVGRRLVTQKSFCRPDPAGPIEVNEQTWILSDTPTRYIYLQFKFDFQDAPADTLYQLGIFLSTIPMFDQPAVSASVLGVGGYPVGTTRISIGNFTQGTLADLYPREDISQNGGRLITVGGQAMRVKGVDGVTGQIIVDPTTETLANGAAVVAPQTTAVLPGQRYLLPEELFDPGIIFLGENRPPMFRNSATREAFEIVLNM